ncbi:MAG: GtrA family protein [Nocardioides sp.]
MSAVLPRLPRTFVRFALVGLTNTAIDVVLFWALQPSLGILAANFVSTSFGMAFSFQMNGRHTFGAARVTSRQVLAFLGTNGLTMWVVQPLVIVAAHRWLGAPVPVTKLVALGSTVLVSFVLYRYVVWREVGLRTVPGPAGLAAAPEAARR